MAEQNKKPKYNVRNSLVNYYLLFMFSLFPVFLTEQYAHARTDKLWFFLVLSGILIISVAAVSVSYTAEDRRIGVKEHFLLPLSAPDIAFLCFFVSAAISTLLSDYKLDSLTGGSGRNNGLILLAFYTLVYFIVSRFYRFKEYIIVVYLVFSMFVALLTVLNFFYIDLFNMYSGYSADVIEDFGSTIGNKNTIASFMCVYLPLALALFTVCSKRYLRVLSGVSIAVAYMGLLCADSSSGFLGMVAILFAVAFLASRSYQYLTRYALALTIMFLSAKVLMLFSLLMGNNSKSLEAIPRLLIFSPLSYIPAAVSAICFVVLFLLRNKFEERYRGKAVKWVFLCAAAVVFVVLAGAFVYFTAVDTTTELGALERILRFDDRWGTHRGFMWINGMKEYGSFDILHKLFGSGPDTFYHVFSPHFSELLERFGDSSTDCIHNEYLNYLITQGIYGLLSYVVLLASAIYRAAKTSRRHPLSAVFICAVVGYAVQAVVNIYQPITTPTVILFLSMSEALNRYPEKEIDLIKI